MLLGKLFQEEKSKGKCKATIEATFLFKSVETEWNTRQIKTSQIFFSLFPLYPALCPLRFSQGWPILEQLKSRRMTSPINCQTILNEQNTRRNCVRLKARVKLSQELFLHSGTCGEIITYTVFNCNVIFVEKHENELLTGPIYSQIIPFWQSLIYKAVKAFVRCFAFSAEALSSQRCTGRVLKADFLLSQLQNKSILNHVWFQLL